jgi:hypothetical protein
MQEIKVDHISYSDALHIRRAGWTSHRERGKLVIMQTCCDASHVTFYYSRQGIYLCLIHCNTEIFYSSTHITVAMLEEYLTLPWLPQVGCFFSDYLVCQ